MTILSFLRETWWKYIWSSPANFSNFKARVHNIVENNRNTTFAVWLFWFFISVRHYQKKTFSINPLWCNFHVTLKLPGLELQTVICLELCSLLCGSRWTNLGICGFFFSLFYIVCPLSQPCQISLLKYIDEYMHMISWCLVTRAMILLTLLGERLASRLCNLFVKKLCDWIL